VPINLEELGIAEYKKTTLKMEVII
jgi:hypothetical protein